MKAYIATKVTTVSQHNWIEQATLRTYPYFDKSRYKTDAAYLTFNNNGNGLPGWRSIEGGGVVVLPTEQFIACVLLDCEPNELPQKNRYECGPVVVDSKGNPFINGEPVNPSQLLAYTGGHYAYLDDWSLEVITGKLKIQGVEQDLENLRDALTS